MKARSVDTFSFIQGDRVVYVDRRRYPKEGFAVSRASWARLQRVARNLVRRKQARRIVTRKGWRLWRE